MAGLFGDFGVAVGTSICLFSSLQREGVGRAASARGHCPFVLTLYHCYNKSNDINAVPLSKNDSHFVLISIPLYFNFKNCYSLGFNLR